MNARERFLAVTHFDKPDYVPLVSCNSIDGPVAETVWKWQREQGMPALSQEPLPEDTFPAYDSFWGSTALARGWDRFWGLTRVHYWSPGSSVLVPDPEVIDDDGTYVTYREADGRVTRELHDNWDRYTMPEFLRYPLAQPHEWYAYKERWLPIEPGVYPAEWEATAAEMRRRTFPMGTSMPGTFGVLRSLFGTAPAAMLMSDEPSTVHDILRHHRQRAFAMAERLMRDAPPDVIGIGEDYCYRSGCFVSPAMFREFFAPHYREIVDFAKQYGVDTVIVDSDGFVEGVVPLLEEAGVRGLQAFEPRAGNDVVRVRRCHPRFVIWGGLDKFVMDQDDAAVVDAEVEGKAAVLLPLGGYLPGIDHGLPPTALYRTYAHFIRSLHELTGNPEGEFWCRESV